MKQISEALVKASAEIGTASKDKTNPHFKSRYADLPSVIEAVRPALARHGLTFIQRFKEAPGGVMLETVILHQSGEQIETGALFVPASKQDAQGYGSAITYARRYSLQTALGVPADDDDGNAAVKQSPVAATMTAENIPVTAKVRAVAVAVREHIANERDYNVFEEIEPLSQDEKVALSSLLNASERARIKKILLDRRNVEKASGVDGAARDH